MNTQLPAALGPQLPIFLEEYFDWAEQQRQPDSQILVDFHLVSNETDGVVTYSEGSLLYHHGGFRVSGRYAFYVPPQFSTIVAGTQYFSDRRFQDQLTTSYPFDHTKLGALTLSLTRNVANSFSGPSAQDGLTAAIQYQNVGDVHFAFNPNVLAGVLYGVGGSARSAARSAIYVISLLNKRVTPNDNATH